MQPETGSGKWTLARLAVEAGVSKSTVSRALSDHPEVNGATRGRIRALAEAVGYRVDAKARALALRKTQTVGVVIPRTARFIFANPYFSQLIQGVGDILDESGYHLLLNTNPEPLTFLGLIRERRVDGLLLTASAMSGAALEAIGREAAAGFPIVLINQPARRVQCASVGVDNAEGIQQAIAYLLGKGHRRIGFIASPAQTVHGRERLRAFAEAMAAAGLGDGGEQPVGGDDTEHGGEHAAAQLLAAELRPSALLCSNDLMAIGALRAARRLGLAVPGDVAVVGFDDIQLAALVQPALTTVRQPIARAGRVAAKLLIERLGEQPAPWGNDRIQLQTELVVRESA